MSRTLFMTVGTGIGADVEEKTRSLAHGLLASIVHYRPEYIVCFGSEESKITIAALTQQFLNDFDDEREEISFITLSKIDDFTECFTAIKNEIEARPGEEIIIDYTSGTKTMTMSAAVASLLYHKKLTLVSGTRGTTGVVQPGTEKINEQNLYTAYDVAIVDQLKDFLNLHRFEASKDLLSQTLSLPAEEYTMYETIIESYSAWDRFRHDDAWEKLQALKSRDKMFAPNKEFLGKLANASTDKKIQYLIADLLNNAKRRLDEGKADDAVARLYRCIELNAQYLLQTKFGIDTSDVNLDILQSHGLNEETINKYHAYENSTGHVQIPLQKGFELLQELGEIVGSQFLDDKQLNDLLKKRNESILAHGLVPVDAASAERMFEIVCNFTRGIIPFLDKLMEKAKFPKL